MSFDAAWLDLREVADHAARDPSLLDEARRYATAIENPLLVDLGAGTGSTQRALALPEARWRLIDRDGTLLGLAARRGGDRTETCAMDLARVDALPLHGARLVTASALLDLVGDAWLEALVARLAAGRTALYAALTYDGVMRWTPADHDDDTVTEAFNRHQRGDKGLGAALGPAAAERLRHVMAGHGYRVRIAPSPWQLGPDSIALQQALLAGIAGAAAEAGFAAHDWLERRLATLATMSCHIGHVDVLAVPAG